MEDLFRQFWWLIFPLAWMVGGMFTSMMNYRRQQKTLDLIKTYADKGQEPPESLMKVLDRPIDSDTEFWQGTSKSSDSNSGNWFCFFLFGGFAAAFAGAGYFDFYGEGQAFYFVAAIMGALTIAFGAAALMYRPKRP